MTNPSVTLNAGDNNVELPVISPSVGADCIDIGKLPKETGMFTYDPGFTATASCKSAITYIDGDQGILLYRGYPIEQLAGHSNFLEVAYLLMHGELPNAEQAAAFSAEVTQHATLPDSLSAMIPAFPRGGHPMAALISMLGGLAGVHHHGLDLDDAEQRRVAATRLIGIVPTLAAASYRQAMGMAVVAPRTDLDYSSRFLSMISDDASLDPVAAKALDLLLILHADHEQNASTSTVRLVGSTGANPYASVASGVAALWGPAHGGANEAVLNMLKEIGTPDKVASAVAKAKDKESGFRLMGFGHRVYKNYDPRAALVRKMTHDILGQMNINDPLLEVAMRLEEAALQDEYFVQRKLYPNVDFYSGIIYKALGIPVEMFTVMFAIGRTAGWVSHWLEQQVDPENKIGRPRQIYTGATSRDYPAKG